MLLLALATAACTSTRLQTYGAIDPAERSITVPPGAGGLTGALKERLRAAGWRLAVAAGPVRTTGTLTPAVQLETVTEARTRYRLLVTSSAYDVCLGAGRKVSYDLSVIDNVTGEEVLAQSGDDCEDFAADKVIAALDGKPASAALPSAGMVYCDQRIDPRCGR